MHCARKNKQRWFWTCYDGKKKDVKSRAGKKKIEKETSDVIKNDMNTVGVCAWMIWDVIVLNGGVGQRVGRPNWDNRRKRIKRMLS